MFRRYSFLLFFALTALNPEMASAQDELSSCKSSYGDAARSEKLEDNSRFYGTMEYPARIICDDMQFFADFAETFKKQDMVTAQGHVVYVSGGNRIAADRMEFNTRTRTGTFYNARGTAILGDQGESTDRSMFGGKEPDAYFWGETLTKLGPKKYKIENGGFTTCVQPTPRWEVVSGSVTINLDDYAFLTNSVFRVKGVPLMYLPIFYYPIQEDDRATGFLIPTYGSSTLKGQMLSNAFFWAIGRSHDATVYHDWMSKAGQQLGGEYRYVLGPGSQGDSRFSLLDENGVTDSSGNVGPGTRSYTISGNMMQRLPRAFSLRANADYFSSIVTQQTYQQDIARATNRNRRFGSYVTGAIGNYQVSATADRTDYFYTATSLTTYGSMPRVNISRAERPIAGSPVYLGVQGEYVTLLRSSSVDDVTTQDQGLTRFDVAPTVRVPFNRWPFLGINSAVTWRATYWTERLQMQVPVPTVTGEQVDEGVARQYFDFSVRATGPVFNRIFNPPEGKEGTKYKHVIQPSVTLQKVTNFDVFDQIVKLESGDYTIGRTQVTYDLTNRLYAKKEVAREIVSFSVNQSYYTDARAAQYDQQYQSSFTAKRATNFSPVALQFRTSPSDRLAGDFRTEWDPTAHALRSIAANASFSSGDWLNGSAGWSQRRFIPELPGFDDPNRVGPVHQLDDQHPRPTQQVRRQLLVQLRRQERPLPQPALDRLLQLPVLRRRCRVPDVQPAGLVRADERLPRPPLQHLVHAGRHRHLLEPVRRVRRAAEPLMTARSGLPLVTGAAGFAGGHLVEHLLENEAAVAAWGHGPVPPASQASERVSWMTVDITDAEAVAAALAETRPSAVFHCAGIADVHSTWSDSATALRVNVLGTHNLLTALERLELDAPVLITGSALVYRPSDTALSEESPIGPASPYGVSKLAQELVGLAARGRVIVTRPFNHAGPRQAPAYATSSFARQIVEAEAGIREPVLEVGNLDARRDITDVRDTVRAYRLLMEKGRAGRPYNVCRGEAFRVGDLLEALVRQSKAAIEVRTDPARLRPNDMPVLLGDPSRLAHDTGWSPRIPIEQTLRDLLDYWRQMVSGKGVPH